MQKDQINHQPNRHEINIHNEKCRSSGFSANC